MIDRASWEQRLRDELSAQVTETAYQIALRHGLHGSFVEVELELWRELTAVIERNLPARVTSELRPDLANGCLAVA